MFGWVETSLATAASPSTSTMATLRDSAGFASLRAASMRVNHSGIETPVIAPSLSTKNIIAVG
jgi:hypothetical protein